MKAKLIRRGAPSFIIASIAAAVGCQRGEQQRGESAPDAPGRPATDPAAPAPNAEPRVSSATPGDRVIEAVCAPASQTVDSVYRAIQAADADGDGTISKTEAYGSANFLVGGFFFKADENSDGTITPEEGRAARMEMMERYPMLGSVFTQARQTTGQSPVARAAELMDIEYGKPVTATELRDAARKAVDQLYAATDANKNGTLTVAEASSAAMDAARAAARSGFQAADANNDGRLDSAEFRRALDTPVDMAFSLADTNNDGHLTEREAMMAANQVAQRFGLPPETSGDKKPQKQ